MLVTGGLSAASPLPCANCSEASLPQQPPTTPPTGLPPMPSPPLSPHARPPWAPPSPPPAPLLSPLPAPPSPSPPPPAPPPPRPRPPSPSPPPPSPRPPSPRFLQARPPPSSLEPPPAPQPLSTLGMALGHARPPPPIGGFMGPVLHSVGIHDEVGAAIALVVGSLLLLFCFFCLPGAWCAWSQRERKKRYELRMEAARKWTPPENVGAPTGAANGSRTLSTPRRSSRRTPRGASLRDLVQRRASSSLYDSVSDAPVAADDDAPAPTARMLSNGFDDLDPEL